MRDHTPQRIADHIGPSDDVLGEFGLTSQEFVHKLERILVRRPLWHGLGIGDVSAILAQCRA